MTTDAEQQRCGNQHVRVEGERANWWSCDRPVGHPGLHEATAGPQASILWGTPRNLDYLNSESL